MPIPHLQPQTLLKMQCVRCGRLIDEEEYIVGWGYCDHCWEHFWKTDPALHSQDTSTDLDEPR